jgi:hypothetical protein
LSSVADHDRANGSKEIISGGLFSAIRGTQVDPEQFPAHDGGVQGFKASSKLSGKIIGLEAGFFFTRGIPDRKTQGHKGPGDGTAIASHAHACAESTAQFKGRLPVEAVNLAETGKDCLGSRVALIKEIDRFFNCVHRAAPWEKRWYHLID